MRYVIQCFTVYRWEAGKAIVQGYKDSEQRSLDLNPGSLSPESGIVAMVTKGFLVARWTLSKSQEPFRVIQYKPG